MKDTRCLRNSSAVGARADAFSSARSSESFVLRFVIVRLRWNEANPLTLRATGFDNNMVRHSLNVT